MGGNKTVGTISAVGIYTSPAVVPSPASFSVTAISQADASNSPSARVTIVTSRHHFADQRHL
jgi:hypothetical protein